MIKRAAVGLDLGLVKIECGGLMLTGSDISAYGDAPNVYLGLHEYLSKDRAKIQ